MPAEPVKTSRRRIFIWLGVGIVAVLVFVLALIELIHEFGEAYGLDCLLTSSIRYQRYSDMPLPPSAEVLAEEYDNWAFLDPRYRIRFRVSERDVRNLLSTRPPWPQREWSKGATDDWSEILFGPPQVTSDDTYSVFETYGTTVHRGFRVNVKTCIVEFAWVSF